MTEAIRTISLRKHFGPVRAVDGIDISVRRGEIYGFLGLNGAGKTTTIRMLLGMIRPTQGMAYLNGMKVTANQHTLWSRVGYLVEIPYAYPDLTVRENLEIIRRLRFLPGPGETDEIIEKLGLAPYRDIRARNLSLGNMQRLGLAKALIHNPDILLLDEPANGLDPAGIAEIRELILGLSARGVTIFISSHILGEISRFATRIGIIHQGKLIRESGTDQLTGLRHRRLLIRTHDMHGAARVLADHGHRAGVSGNDLIIIDDEQALNSPEQINTLLVQDGFPPGMLKVEEEDLEACFFRVIGQNNEMP